jgi:hypothetical protein
VSTLPVIVADLARGAVEGFPAAMKDDPTLWPAGSAPMVSEVIAAAREVVRDNFRSLLSRRIGPHIQNVVTDMETAIAEDGPLADLASVWSTYVEGFDLEDYDTLIKAKDWDARVEALSEQVGGMIAGFPAPAVPGSAIDAYIADDPRLADLAVSQKHDCARPAETAPAEKSVMVRYFAHPESDSVFTTEDGSRPVGDGMVEELDKEQYDAIVARKALETAPAEKPAAFSWDDEENEAGGGETVALPPQPGEVSAEVAPALPLGELRPMPLLFRLLDPIGVLATDFADVTGINKATISNAKSGKRAWLGLSERQAHRLADELDARAEASLALSRRLRAMEPSVVDGNKA